MSSSPVTPTQSPGALLPLRVLICAADLVARVGLGALLQEDARFAISGQCAPTDDLSAALALYTPDVVLWDLGWSAMDWLSELQDFMEHELPTLALIADGDDASTVWATGVRGLLLRDSSPALLSDALAAIVHNIYLFDPAFADTISLAGGENLAVDPLTPREMDVLQALAQGLSNKLIARELSISEHTVKFHLNAILGKLGAQSRTEAVVRATQAGLIRL